MSPSPSANESTSSADSASAESPSAESSPAESSPVSSSSAESTSETAPPVERDEVPRRGTGLRRAVLRAVVRNLPSEPPADVQAEEPPRRVGSYAQWLPLLRAIPWLLGAVFVLSFAWDFPGRQITVFGHTMVVEGLLRTLTVSGLIGFGTNWLAITMLFQPREPRPIVGQGLIPEQRERVAWRLAQAVSDELINEAIIVEKIHETGLAARYRDLALSVAEDVTDDAAFRRELKAVLRRTLRDVLEDGAVQRRIVDFTAEQLEENARGLPGLALQTYRMVNEDRFQAQLREAVERLPHSIAPLVDEVDPFLDSVPSRLRERADDIEELITQLVVRFVETIDVQRIVLDNVRSYDEQQLENLLKRTTNEQLNYIKYLGAVLGVVGGLVIWQPAASLILLTAVGLTLWAVDEGLYRMRKGMGREA